MTEIAPDKKGYAVVLIFESTSDSPEYPGLYEEEIVMIRASTKEDAKQKSAAYAKEQEHSYQNELGETIHVSFKALIDVQEMMEEPDSGTTLYCRHFRDYSSYENFEPLLNGQPL